MNTHNASLASLIASRLASVSLALVVVTMIVSLSPTSVVAQISKLQITSAEISAGAAIPIQFTCSGANQSPPLEWTGVPQGTKSLALIMQDPDAPSGTFVHWVVYDIPPVVSGFRQNTYQGKEGANSMGKEEYMGPCPPPGNPHHYHFKLYALDAEPNFGERPNADVLRQAMDGHIMQSADLIGIFSR